MSIGPVEYMVVGFQGNNFTGEIAPALGDLVKSGTVRVIDLAFVSKDRDGNIAAMEVEDLDSEAGAAFQAIEESAGDLVSEEDLMKVGESLEPNSSAAVLIWEDVWATRLADAIADAGGEVLGLERIPRDVVRAALQAAGSEA